MAFCDLVVALVFAGQMLGHRLEPVARDLHARGEVHHRGLEHQLVVRLGLDQHDVHARIALLPVLGQLVQPLVGDQLERLVADLREAHVRDPPRALSAQRLDGSGEVVDERHDRVDHDDQVRPGLDRDVEVRRRDDPAVDQLAVVDPHRRVDHRQRPGGANRRRDRHVFRALGAEHDPLAGVEVRGRHVELARQLPEIVGAAGLAEHLVQVVLDPGARVHARGQPLGEAQQDVHQRHGSPLGDHLAGERQRAQRQHRDRARELDAGWAAAGRRCRCL